MASTSAFSLQFLSLATPTLSLPASKPTIASLSVFSLPSLSLKLPISSSSRPFSAPSSRFLTKVALSSEVEEEEEEEDFLSGDGEERSFSPALKLFVGNLPFSVDSAALAGLFARAGNVEMVEVIYDKQTGRSRGFGFVTMSTVEEVEAAAQQFNGYELEGRALRVNSGPPPPREASPFQRVRGGGPNIDSSNRLHVGNLDWGVDNLALETLFSEQGKVMDAKVVYDRDSGRSRGFGFVTYSTADEVKNAIESLDGVDLRGRAIRVSHAEARPRRQFD